MSYKSLRACVEDLEQHGKLLRIKVEVDPNLEMAEIHRRVYAAQGPAILFEKVKGSPFQALSNLYGTNERTEFIFRKTITGVQKVIELKIDPMQALKNPLRYLTAPFTALKSLPSKKWFKSPIEFSETTIDQLPQVVSWPMDGGAFVTLPQVYSEDPEKPGIMNSNIGMYRIQLSGNQYVTNKEIGLHYQIHRGIGVHHEMYNKSDKPFRVSIFVGGPPSHAFAAIMPLPEGLSETLFAGMLNGRRFGYKYLQDQMVSTDADFVIVGTIRKNEKKPEGPFGDHLGYYSLTHDFPVMDVEKVYHRKDPIWHFTAVGRPPAEDSGFGYMIHKIVEKLTPQEFPGLVELHAVDAAGVHPLLLAIGKERYMPFRERKPEEILTIANKILGTGQTSLAKFLFIAADGDDDALDTHHMEHYFQHFMARVDWRKDLHFQTNTTIDTLDYSGSSWNGGSKVVVACCGKVLREPSNVLPSNFSLPNGFSTPVFFDKGILMINAPKFEDYETAVKDMDLLTKYLENVDLKQIPMIVVVDDSTFAAATTNNFVWVTFTRANPSHDVYGVRASTNFKHWGCENLVIDARIKPHHAPELVPDPEVTKRVDVLFEKLGLKY
jgi:4-hydroxy-3-polyprenylbenzoate decarboxylase